MPRVRRVGPADREEDPQQHLLCHESLARGAHRGGRRAHRLAELALLGRAGGQHTALRQRGDPVAGREDPPREDAEPAESVSADVQVVEPFGTTLVQPREECRRLRVGLRVRGGRWRRLLGLALARHAVRLGRGVGRGEGNGGGFVTLDGECQGEAAAAKWSASPRSKADPGMASHIHSSSIFLGGLVQKRSSRALRTLQARVYLLQLVRR